MYSEEEVEDFVGVWEKGAAWHFMNDQVCDSLWVCGGELEGDNAAAAAGEEVELLGTETESILQRGRCRRRD